MKKKMSKGRGRFDKDGYEFGGPDMSKTRPLTKAEAEAVGKALGRDRPEPTFDKRRLAPQHPAN